MFTEKELAYIKSQPLARLATVDQDGQPDASPVGFEYDGQYFYIGGRNPTQTRKYRNLRAGNKNVALVIDDLESIRPWKPRGIRIYGYAEIIEREGRFGYGSYIRVTPTTSWSWSIENPAFNGHSFDVHKTTHTLG